MLPHFLAQELFQASALLCSNQVWNQLALQGKWCLETKTQTQEVVSDTVRLLLLGCVGEQGNRAVQNLPLVDGDQGGRREEGCIYNRNREAEDHRETCMYMRTDTYVRVTLIHKSL